MLKHVEEEPASQATDQVDPNAPLEEMPQFPGGEEALFKYLQAETQYPQAAFEQRIEGIVYATFVIDKDGTLKETKVLRGIGNGCDEEALRVVQNMPTWTPGRQNGKNVSVQYNLPVRFSLKTTKKPKK